MNGVLLQAVRAEAGPVSGVGATVAIGAGAAVVTYDMEIGEPVHRFEEAADAIHGARPSRAADAAGAAPAAGAPEGEAEQPAAAALPEAAVRGWSVEQVGRWLRGEVEAAAAPGLADPALVARFAQQEVGGGARLELRVADLRDALGIAAFGRRNRILKAGARTPPAASRGPAARLTAGLAAQSRRCAARRLHRPWPLTLTRRPTHR